LTVPLVGPSSFFLLIMNVIYSFQVFDLVFVMTGGGPENAPSVLVTYAYDNGFVTRDQGYAAALGLALLLIMLVFTAVQWRISRTRDLVGSATPSPWPLRPPPRRAHHPPHETSPACVPDVAGA